MDICCTLVPLDVITPFLPCPAVSRIFLAKSTVSGMGESFCCCCSCLTVVKSCIDRSKVSDLQESIARSLRFSRRLVDTQGSRVAGSRGCRAPGAVYLVFDMLYVSLESLGSCSRQGLLDVAQASLSRYDVRSCSPRIPLDPVAKFVVRRCIAIRKVEEKNLVKDQS